MLSNILSQPHQQLEEYLLGVKIALEENNFESLEQLVNNHSAIMDILNAKVYREEVDDIISLQKSYNKVSYLLIEAQNLKEELCWSLRVVGKKKQQITAYVKSQF